jgi:hypothetical protein
VPDITFKIVESYELSPYVEDLRALEAEMSYPLDDDTFIIDHGEDYHPFFSEMGAARFLLVLVDGVVLGTMAGVWREVEIAGVSTTSVYLGDFKLAKSLRGGEVARKLAMHVLREWWQRPTLGGWNLVFGAAMRGDRGDVMRTTVGSGYHAGRLLEPMAKQVLYFVSPAELAKVSSRGEPLWTTEYADLTPGAGEGVERTDGRKDFQLQSTGKPWPLAHLPLAPQRCPLGYGEYLRRCARTLIEQDLSSGRRSIACFGLDARATHAIGWLERHGLEPGARCTLYGVHFPGAAHPSIHEVPYVHLSTAMI